MSRTSSGLDRVYVPAARGPGAGADDRGGSVCGTGAVALELRLPVRIDWPAVVWLVERGGTVAEAVRMAEAAYPVGSAARRRAYDRFRRWVSAGVVGGGGERRRLETVRGCRGRCCTVDQVRAFVRVVGEDLTSRAPGAWATGRGDLTARRA